MNVDVGIRHTVTKKLIAEWTYFAPTLLHIYLSKAVGMASLKAWSDLPNVVVRTTEWANQINWIQPLSFKSRSICIFITIICGHGIPPWEDSPTRIKPCKLQTQPYPLTESANNPDHLVSMWRSICKLQSCPPSHPFSKQPRSIGHNAKKHL